MNDSEGVKFLQRVYGANNNQELEARYDEWAERYEADVCSYGYMSPVITSGLIGRYVKPQDGVVLDAGAGTGLIGEIMAALGYRDLVAIDLSQGMLDIARKKGVYQDLRKMMLGEHLDFPDSTFAAVVACGVFALGHAPPESLNELVRITRPEGCVIFTIRTEVYLHKGFKEKQEALEKEGKWRLIEMAGPYQSLSLAKLSEKPGPTHHAYVYQVP